MHAVISAVAKRYCNYIPSKQAFVSGPSSVVSIDSSAIEQLTGKTFGGVLLLDFPSRATVFGQAPRKQKLRKALPKHN